MISPFVSAASRAHGNSCDITGRGTMPPKRSMPPPPVPERPKRGSSSNEPIPVYPAESDEVESDLADEEYDGDFFISDDDDDEKHLVGPDS